MRTTAIAAAALLTAVTARDWVALAAARAAADEPRACGPNCMDLRTPYLESSGWGAARYCAAPPCFVVRRLSKTGGSFLSGVVERVVARRRRAVIKDDVPVPCAYRSNASLAASFFVGVVRNPCEFYASLAQDVPEQAFAEPYGAAEPWFRGPVVTKAELRATRPQRNGSGPAPAALRAWLDATLRGDLGYFSYHFWVSYVRNECVDTDMTASDRRAPCPRDACAPEDFGPASGCCRGRAFRRSSGPRPRSVAASPAWRRAPRPRGPRSHRRLASRLPSRTSSHSESQASTCGRR